MGSDPLPPEAAQSKPGANRVILKILLYLAMGYGGLLVIAFFLQTRILFPATREIYRDPSALHLPFEEVSVPVMGFTTHGWFVPLKNARGVALFSHGNAGNIADRLESIQLLRSMGFSVLAYDYGGYGRSTGKVGEERCCADAEAMWRYLTETRGIPPGQILIFGRSLGGAVSVDLASKVKPGAVILESTFLSTIDVARSAFPWLPARLVMRHRFMSKDKVARITAPTLYIHSPEDDIIPYSHGQRLYELATAPKQFLEIHGKHNDGFVISGPIYLKGWEDFLDPLLPRPGKNSGRLDTISDE